MTDFTLKDELVKVQFAEERKEQAEIEFTEDDYEGKLDLDKTCAVKNTLRNLTLILEHNENLQGIVFNELSDNLEIVSPGPWSHPSKYWRDADDAQLVSYIDTPYGTFSARNYYIAITKVADDRSYHPIRDYHDELPEWDKEP